MFKAGLKMTIKSQLAALILIMVISVVSIEVINFFKFESLTRDRMMMFTLNMFKQIEDNIHNYLEDNRRIALSVAYNKELQNFLTSEDMLEKFESNIKLTNFMSNTMNLKDNIDGISILNEKSIMTYGIAEENDKIKRLIDASDKPFYTPIVKSSNKELRFFYYYVIPVYDTESDNRSFNRIGTMAFTLNTDNFNRVLNNIDLLPHSLFVILDTEGKVVAKNHSEISDLHLKDLQHIGNKEEGYEVISYQGEKCIYQNKAIDMLGWSIISIVPLKQLTSEIAPFRRFSVIFLVILLSSVVIISIYIFRNITIPIKEILDFSSQKVGSGNLKERLDLTVQNELTTIAIGINSMLDQLEDMTRRIFDTQEKLYLLEINKKQAELNYLQSQINPHFLYNTLECIKSIASVYKVKPIGEIAVAMANIFRYSIQYAEDVKLKDELECVYNYFKIIDIRYMGRFKLNMHHDEDVLDIPAMKMLLQPLVENAVYHGLESKRGDGEVTIRIFQCDTDMIEIWIEDNGKGISTERLKQINQMLHKKEDDVYDTYEKRSIGIINISNRIRYSYGEQYDIFIESEEDKGTKVRLRLPSKNYKKNK